MSQRTLVLLKPDAVRRGLVGEILGRIERKAGWTIRAMELRTLDRGTLEQHYAEHVGRPFYEPLVEFMESGPSVALVVEGERVVEGLRTLAGPTDPIAATPGSIRGISGRSSGRTWCTPRTPRSPPNARSSCSSPVWPNTAAGQGIYDGRSGTKHPDTTSPLQRSAVCSDDNDVGTPTPRRTGRDYDGISPLKLGKA